MSHVLCWEATWYKANNLGSEEREPWVSMIGPASNSSPKSLSFLTYKREKINHLSGFLRRFDELT